VVINLYDTERGFCPAESLTPDEAVALHHRGLLEVADYKRLSFAGAFAVFVEIEKAVRGRRPVGTVIFFGVKSPVRAHQGKA